MPTAALDVRERLRGRRPLLLDGALGTELERLGSACTLPLWSTHALLAQPERVRAVHRAYVEAGAEVLTANTFRTQQRTLARAGLGAEAGRLCALAIQLAREAGAEAANAGQSLAVAGSAPPLEDCFRPDLVPNDAALHREHAVHARNLALAGADLILCETLNCVREARATAEAAAATRLPFFVSFVCGSQARLLSGEPLAAGLQAVATFAPTAVLVNCLPLAEAAACLPVLASCGMPFGVYANLGTPVGPASAGWTADVAPAPFAAASARWIAAGAQIVGGCCGTRPAHIRAIADRLTARG